jgi:ribosomal protein S12 methylthiotransferase accessory factor
MQTHARPRPGSPAPKRYREGTARTRTPAETLDLLLPHLARFGLTRLANVTGLDRIGIPVYQAIRPNARSLAVSQGKGLDNASAKVSAVMESLEMYHAEHARCPLRLESQRALSRHARVADPARLPLARAGAFHPDLTLPWAEGRELGSDEPVFVPFELVHANYTVPRVPGSGAFAPSTSGLCAGNHPTEAALHGVCELIERDAETLFRLGEERARDRARVALETVDAPAARALIDLYRRAGIETMIWDMTSDVGIASFNVFIYDTEADADLNPYPAANGSGTHPDRGIALCRALTEAAQSRLTAIAGSRDDLTVTRYRAFQSAESLARYRELARATAQASFEHAPHFDGETLAEDLAHVLSRLAERGMHEAIAVDLSIPGDDFAFVRMLVPGLESAVDSPSYAPRARALSRLT